MLANETSEIPRSAHADEFTSQRGIPLIRVLKCEPLASGTWAAAAITGDRGGFDVARHRVPVEGIRKTPDGLAHFRSLPLPSAYEDEHIAIDPEES